MTAKTLLLAAAAAALALPALAPPALAQGGPPGPRPESHPGRPGQGPSAPRPQLVPLAQAVATAERTVGGRAFDAELDRERGGAVYEVDVAKRGRAVEVYVDAATGRVISRRQPSGPRLPFTREHLKVAQSAPRSLAQTIAMVEKSTGGRVTEIGLERHAGRYYYEAELAGGRDREVRVDLRTGAVTPVRNR